MRRTLTRSERNSHEKTEENRHRDILFRTDCNTSPVADSGDGGAISGAVMPVPTRIAAEMLAATKGVGYMIEYARELSQPEKLFVGLLSIGVIGLVTDAVILAVQKRLIVWN